MALDFLKQLHNRSLANQFNQRPAKPPKDPMPKRRDSIAASIDKVLAALKAGEDKPKGGHYFTKPHTDVIKCRVKYGSRILTINGEQDFYVQDAPAFYKNMKDAALKGDLDSAINAAIEGKSTRRGDPTAPSAPRPKRIMSDEHRAKIAAAAKARHAAKAAK